MYQPAQLLMRTRDRARPVILQMTTAVLDLFSFLVADWPLALVIDFLFVFMNPIYYFTCSPQQTPETSVMLSVHTVKAAQRH